MTAVARKRKTKKIKAGARRLFPIFSWALRRESRANGDFPMPTEDKQLSCCLAGSANRANSFAAVGTRVIDPFSLCSGLHSIDDVSGLH